jgi:phosphatidylserine/phosphatidylglycerophosphate/cardiolipin synthase-like enzyme
MIRQLLLSAATFLLIQLSVAQSISMTSEPTIENLTSSGFDVTWTTDTEGSSEAFWGNTPSLEQPPVKEAGTGTTHQLSISGLTASTLVYMQPFSVSGSDTAYSGKVMIHITSSESTGDIKVYFNATVDTSKAISIKAIYVENAIADTLVNYLNRAKSTIDFATYNMDTYNSAQIASALNAAHNRGVTVRVVYDGGRANTGVDQLNGSIGKIASPTSSEYGIMHNKFVVIDANTADANDAIVWTGSTNFTSGQLNTDPNDVIIIQDKSLALAYTMEFNEMFGSTGATPNVSLAKFGFDKEDNTPHEFIIGGKRVESYFSPTDGAHDKIIEVINSASSELHIATMLITREDIARAIRDSKNAGAETLLIIDDIDEYSQDNILVTSLDSNFRTMGEPGIMHHKYMIVDHTTSDSDPMLLTGCHNWSTSAKDRNDENTLIVHDQEIANLYYQEFAHRFYQGDIVAVRPVCEPDSSEITPEQSSVTIPILSNDFFEGQIIVEITRDTELGIAEIKGDNTLSYRPKVGFEYGIDTVMYSVCAQDYGSLCDETFVKINVDVNGVSYQLTQPDAIVEIFPTRGVGTFTVKGLTGIATLSVISPEGKVVHRELWDGFNDEKKLDLTALPSGVYYVQLKTKMGSYHTKSIIIQK